jgi:hypothetical protein
MAGQNGRSMTQVRQDIQRERMELAAALTELRGESAGLTAKVRSKLPLAVGGAVAAGFLLAAALGATMRFFARRGR